MSIPTIKQGRCIRMLQDWAGGVQALGAHRLVGEESVHVLWPHMVDVGGAGDDLTRLILLAHRDGIAVCLQATAPGEMLIAARAVESDRPSLTKLRRRAHGDRVMGYSVKERKEGA
jgi:hypothetical protein